MKLTKMMKAILHFANLVHDEQDNGLEHNRTSHTGENNTAYITTRDKSPLQIKWELHYLAQNLKTISDYQLMTAVAMNRFAFVAHNGLLRQLIIDLTTSNGVLLIHAVVLVDCYVLCIMLNNLKIVLFSSLN